MTDPFGKPEEMAAADAIGLLGSFSTNRDNAIAAIGRDVQNVAVVRMAV